MGWWRMVASEVDRRTRFQYCLRWHSQAKPLVLVSSERGVDITGAFLKRTGHPSSCQMWPRVMSLKGDLWWWISLRMASSCVLTSHRFAPSITSSTKDIRMRLLVVPGPTRVRRAYPIVCSSIADFMLNHEEGSSSRTTFAKKDEEK